MKIVSSARASREQIHNFDYLFSRSPKTARRFSQAVKTTLQQLSEHPESGQSFDGSAKRVIPLNGFPFLIYYRIDRDTLTILSIFHTAQDPARQPD
ncbi:MAG: type II toxin-antitoxin system RelE/ParE family toxin [Pseudomonadota bacterium]